MESAETLLPLLIRMGTSVLRRRGSARGLATHKRQHDEGRCREAERRGVLYF